MGPAVKFQKKLSKGASQRCSHEVKKLEVIVDKDRAAQVHDWVWRQRLLWQMTVSIWRKSGFLLGNSSCKTEMSHSTLQEPTSNKMWGEGGCRKAGGERVRTATAAARQDRRWPAPGANQTTCTFRKNSFSLNSDVFWHTVQIKHMCKITQKHTIVYGGKYRNTFDLH